MSLFPQRIMTGRFRPVVTAYYFKEWRGYETRCSNAPPRFTGIDT